MLEWAENKKISKTSTKHWEIELLRTEPNYDPILYFYFSIKLKYIGTCFGDSHTTPFDRIFWVENWDNKSCLLTTDNGAIPRL